MGQTRIRNAGRWRIGRLGRLMVATLVTVTSVLAFSGSPASAAGGGCRPHSNTYFSFDACIGDDGILAYGDVYIKRYSGSNCSVTISVTNGSSDTHPCRIGHLGPETAPMQRGVSYYTSITIRSSAGQLFGISPRAWKP